MCNSRNPTVVTVVLSSIPAKWTQVTVGSEELKSITLDLFRRQFTCRQTGFHVIRAKSYVFPRNREKRWAGRLVDQSLLSAVLAVANCAARHRGWPDSHKWLVERVWMQKKSSWETFSRKRCHFRIEHIVNVLLMKKSEGQGVLRRTSAARSRDAPPIREKIELRFIEKPDRERPHSLSGYVSHGTSEKDEVGQVSFVWIYGRNSNKYIKRYGTDSMSITRKVLSFYTLSLSTTCFTMVRKKCELS